MLIMYSVECQCCGECHAAEECGGVCVEAGGYAAPVFETVEAAFDGVALFVDGRFE